MAHKLIYDGLNVAIFLDMNRMEEIALGRVADCLSWQEQKEAYLARTRRLTPELRAEIRTFRDEAYSFVERKCFDEKTVRRYLI